MPKTPIDIEQLLRWAYRDELPKGYERGVGEPAHCESIWRLGVSVSGDKWACEPGFPARLGPPHPDALQVDWYVRQLEDIKLDWAASRIMVMGELAPYAPVGDPAVSAMSFETSALVQMHARMGTRPIWQMGQVTLRRVLGRNGKPTVNGISRGGRYGVGASCPLVLDPPAAEIACARAEYWVWHSALTWLAAESWTLDDHTPLPPRAAALPWIGDTERKGRILPSNLPPTFAPEKPLTTKRRSPCRVLVT